MTDIITHVVDEEMTQIDRRDKNKNELHTSLDEEIKFVWNSLNIVVGQTGSGKSRTVFREISKLNYVDNNPYNQFVYIADEENDKTFIKYRDMIERRNKITGKIEGIPIVKLRYEQAYEYLIKLIKAKNLYERIQKKPSIRRDDEKELLLDFLGVTGFETPVLHTIILFDDATDCFKNKKDL
jgi:Cdc6-like AAA superfamily ATPase